MRILDRQLADFRPDVVAWWSMGGLSLTMLETSRGGPNPAVAFVHDEWLDYGRRVDPWLKFFTGPRRGRFAHVVERVRASHLGRLRPCRPLRVRQRVHPRQGCRAGLGLESTAVAHSGIHIDFLAAAAEREWGWRLLYVGRIDERKGIDTAIAALRHLPAEAALVIAGSWDPAEESRLRELAACARCRRPRDLPGRLRRGDLIEAYDDADAVVFPVRWDEPWGLVPLEAMGRGRPVIATGRGGSAEYLRDGENCLLFDAEDEGALAMQPRDSPITRASREPTGCWFRNSSPIHRAHIQSRSRRPCERPPVASSRGQPLTTSFTSAPGSARCAGVAWSPTSRT